MSWVRPSIPGTLLLLVLVAPATSQGRERVTSQDRSATYAYLQAELDYEQAVVASAPASAASLEALAARLDGECPGVVAGVHKRLTAVSESAPSPRQDGEQARKLRQWQDLDAELARVMELSRDERYRQAALAFTHKLRTLRWSDETITAVEHAIALATEWEVQGLPPQVCADMSAWVLSGYKTLAPATKALAREREAVAHPVSSLLKRLPEGPLAVLSDPLSRYEGPRGRALARKLRALQQGAAGAFNRVITASQHIELALGVTSEAELHELREFTKVPPEGAAVIAKGKSAAGGSFTVWVETKKPGPGSGSAGRRARPFEPFATPKRCGLKVDFLETEPSSSGVFAVEPIRNMGEACLYRSQPKAPRVQCDEGEITIEAQTRARARKVRLTLSDGRQITSRVGIVPAKLGGPASFYYQAVQGSGPRPVSLTELDRRGKELRMITLPRLAKCVKPPPPTQPGSIRTLATGVLPQGPGFSITGERTNHGGRPLGGPSVVGSDVSLQLELTNEGEAGGIEREGGNGAIGAPPGFPGQPRRAQAFGWEIKTGCQPHEFAILFGILKARKDRVLVRTSTGLEELVRVRIPGSLRAHGVLAYAALTGVPRELLLRETNGKVVLTEQLAGIMRDAQETCEGESEG
jgi:hypothetical protein